MGGQGKSVTLNERTTNERRTTNDERRTNYMDDHKTPSGFFHNPRANNQYYEYIRIDMIVKEYRVDFKKPLKASYLQRF